MIGSKPRVCWSALCVGLLASGLPRSSSFAATQGEAIAQEVAASTADDPSLDPAITVARQAAPPAGVTGLPKDLAALTHDELVDLVKDLTLQNQMLAVKLARQQQALAEAAPDLQSKIDYQARTIERLQAKLAQAQRDAAAQAALHRIDDDATDPAAPGVDPSAATDAWEYRFAYEFGLIRTSGDGRIVLRDDNGKRQVHEFDYTQYRRDALWVNLLIRNDSKQPMRFAGLIELQGDKAFLRDQRPRYATHAFRTPLLEPGEVFQINEDELLVDRPWKIDAIELTNVQAFPTPADPAPDAGKS